MSKTVKKEYKANSKKSLCKSKKEKKCKKIKGCKMTKGPKKTFCRKIRNKKYNKTKKTKGFIKEGYDADFTIIDMKKIKALMDGIKNIDAQTINKIKSGDKEVIMKMIMQNPELRTLLIGKLRQELTKNPEMQKLAMEVMRSSMKGGDDFDRSENSVDALKRVYSNKNPDELI